MKKTVILTFTVFILLGSLFLLWKKASRQQAQVKINATPIKQTQSANNGKDKEDHFNYQLSEITSDTKIGLAKYQYFLKTLNRKDANSVRLGANCYINNFGGSSQTIRDEAFKWLYYFYKDFVNSNNVDIGEEPNQDTERLCRKNGMLVDCSEGESVLVEDSYFLSNVFSVYVSEPMKKYLELNRDDIKGGLYGDGSLMISFSEIGDRLKKWEDFSFKYPNFILVKEAKGNYEMYLEFFLQGGGQDTFSFEVTFSGEKQQFGELLPEAREAYENYDKLNLHTSSGRLVREFYTLLKENHFKYGDNITEFYKRNHIQPLVEIWSGKNGVAAQL